MTPGLRAAGSEVDERIHRTDFNHADRPPPRRFFRSDTVRTGERCSTGAVVPQDRMRIIFLDIDGVLNCKNTPNPRKFPFMVDHRLLSRLKRLLELTGAKVVLSSNWRYDPAGLYSATSYGIPFIASTPDLPGEPRCKAILAWLHYHPNVERFIVIDDEDDELDGLPLFQPLRSTGLTDALVNNAADYLNGKTNEDMRRNKIVRICQNICALVIGHKG